MNLLKAENAELVKREWPELADHWISRVLPDRLDALLDAAREEGRPTPTGEGGELVERLRAIRPKLSGSAWSEPTSMALLTEAATLISTLQARVAELEGAASIAPDQGRVSIPGDTGLGRDGHD